MKKIIFSFFLFLFYTSIICFYPAISSWDRNVIHFVQELFGDIPLWVALLPDSCLYVTMLILPLSIGFIYFFKKLLIIDAILFSMAPLISYIINTIIKNIVQRPRPPFELQIAVHPSSYSFVSNHTFITCSLWGLVVFYLVKYCKNKFLKISGIIISFFWMIFIGLSRIWLGVHNPTDVFGGYFLALIFLSIYIKIIKLIGGKP